MARTQTPSAYDRSVKARAVKPNPSAVLTNSERSLTAGDEGTINALDAAEAGHAEAPKLLVGALATIRIGSDSYAAKVVSVSPSMKTIGVMYTNDGIPDEDKEPITFRLNKWGQYRFRKSYMLHIGEARTSLDPSL